ncbi:olfactory receptor 13D1-like [Anomaloglossus baeobatrachus]|uniref:olfactory receptor 13D1-like n=1 Tax=Anomaloglossus baeobatrachus TaxID=238106 RepID=UPI003F4F850E
MENNNQTFTTYFIFIGLSKNFQICIFLFVVFFLIYVLTVLGNSVLIIIVMVSPQLHTPMYYFLGNLSFLDLFFSSCNVPKMLFDLLSEERRISVVGCLIQMNISLFLGGIECMLLPVMAYDRYIAICLPLYYTTIMNWTLCKCLTVIMWVLSFILSIFPTLFKPLVFCKGRNLDHFACEILGLLDLACGDLSFYKIGSAVISFFTLFLPFTFIVVSYICIIISIWNIHSSDGRSKAFSTCSSHLTVVLMFFGTSMAMYMVQKRSSSSHLKYTSLIYGVVTPVLNPLIYSLRNNEVKEISRKLLLQFLALST